LSTFKWGIPAKTFKYEGFIRKPRQNHMEVFMFGLIPKEEKFFHLFQFDTPISFEGAKELKKCG
jgi:hypothetical protein